MAYAVDTKVSVIKSQGEIRALVQKRGASMFAIMEDVGKAQIAFRMVDRNIIFKVPMPPKAGSSQADANRRDKVMRSRWRALLLVIKAKLESVDSGIETLEEAFLSQTMNSTGRTVYEETKEPLAINYKGGNVPLLQLEGPKK